jgi:hypothetical protein
MLVTQLSDFAFLRPLAQVGIPETVLSQIKEVPPSIFSRTASSEYPNVPQAVLDLASANYDQVVTVSCISVLLIRLDGLSGVILLQGDDPVSLIFCLFFNCQSERTKCQY